MRIDKDLALKYSWIPLTALLIVAVIIIVLLASRRCSRVTEYINWEAQNTTTHTEDKCNAEEIAEIQSSYYSLETIEKIENETSYGIVITKNKLDEYGNNIGQCKYYITDLIENGLEVSNDKLSSLSNIIYLNPGYIAYAYGEGIYVQELEEGTKPVLVASQDLASDTSLSENGERVLIDGPYAVNDDSRPGISDTDQFFFLVDFIYGCELDTPEEYCDRMGVIFRELEERGIVGWWLYKGNQSKQIVHLDEE